MNRFTLALGSNQGIPIQNLKRAVKEISGFATIIETSPCFQTPPLLPPGAPTEWFRFFANAAITIDTPLTASELLARTQATEQRLGRSEVRERWSPRPLDIDLLFTHPYRELHTADLKLPHPEWKNRNFVLAPLLHLTPPAGLPGSLVQLARGRRNMPPALMVALNATPDSFSQTTNAMDPSQWLKNFQNLLDQDVAFIDIGGESTRPGATALGWQEEWNRIEPLLDHWRSVRAEHPFTRLSLDTYHPETARRALDYKVNILNDVTHLSTPAMREVAGHFEAVILMHSLTVPADKNKTWPPGTDVIGELKKWFDAKTDQLRLPIHQLIFDPGLGFGKTPLQSLQILQRVEELAELPVRRLIGHSRKSFMSSWSDTPAPDRDLETLGASLALAHKNIEILRVHNAEAHRRALTAMSAIQAEA